MAPNTTNTTNDIPAPDLMMTIITGTIGAIGLPGNVFLMLLILSDFKNRRPHEWLLFAMALGDSVSCFADAILEPVFIRYPDSTECKVTGAIVYTFGVSSLLTPALASYNRYLSLYDSQKHAKLFTSRKTLLFLTGILGFCSGWVLMFAASGNLGKDDLGLCGLRVRTPILAASTIFIGVVMTIAYCLILYFSYKVGEKIRAHKKNTSDNSQLYSRLISESREIITIVVIISIIPLFAQVPGVMCKTLQSFLPHPFDPWVSRAAAAPFPLTSAANGPITLFVVKCYRLQTKRFFTRAMRKIGTKPSTVIPEVLALS